MKSKIMTRMKEQYENRFKQFLMRRCPTIIRLDGKAFHTYTKGLDKPFDEGLIEDMQLTAQYLCENVQGCKLAYTQSDEISLLLTDYETEKTDAWFDYNVQKLTSISASLATARFNQLRNLRYYDESSGTITPYSEIKLAMFDSRVFQIADKEEVVNYFIARQQDAERNSIQMLAQSLYSHKELLNKNSSELQELCFQKGHNWNDLDFSKKRGSLILKNTYINSCLVDNGRGIINKGTLQEEVKSYIQEGIWYDQEDNVMVEPTIRNKWEVIGTPIFTKDRNCIMDLL